MPVTTTATIAGLIGKRIMKGGRPMTRGKRKPMSKGRKSSTRGKKKRKS
jgi:hypothetical protein